MKVFQNHSPAHYHRKEKHFSLQCSRDQRLGSRLITMEAFLYSALRTCMNVKRVFANKCEK